MLIKALQTGKRPTMNIFDSFIFILAIFSGGYTIINFPIEFRTFFSTPIGRFVAFLSILYVFYRDNLAVSVSEIIYEALLYVIIFELLERLIHVLN